MKTSSFRGITCSLIVTLLSLSHVLAEENQTTTPNEAVTGKICHVTATIVGTVKHADEDELLIEVTSTRTVEQGVPHLSKLPYVNRLFKNVGRAQSTAVIRVPRSQVTAITSCENECCSDGYCTENSACCPPLVTWRAISRLPSPQYLQDDVQYFQLAPEIKLCGTTDGCCKASKTVAKCTDACGSCCQAKATAACENCQCCAGCKCDEPSTVHNVTIHQQLVRAMTENAQLKAREEARREIISQRDQSVKEIVQAKLEVAKLQTQVELAKQREDLMDTAVDALVENAKLQAIVEMSSDREELLMHIAKSQSKNRVAGKSKRNDSLKQVKAENARLKALISALEKRLDELANANRDSVVR